MSLEGHYDGNEPASAHARLERLTDHRAKRSRRIGRLHGMSWRRRGCQQVADGNGGQVSVDFAVDFPDQSDRHPGVFCLLLIESDAGLEISSARDDSSNPPVVGFLAWFQCASVRAYDHYHSRFAGFCPDNIELFCAVGAWQGDIPGDRDVSFEETG